jgi:CheY-like chemotaxis protein
LSPKTGARQSAPHHIQTKIPAKKPVHILVVEDHADTRNVLSRALRRRGFLVEVAENSAVARDVFCENVPDLILCDLGLPDGTGWDLFEQLRGIQPVPAIAMSGLGMDSDIARSREVGFTVHLVKPLSLERLTAEIAHILDAQDVSASEVA